ncbi:MAG: hypothetical protein ABJE10_21450 [bacterium]
MTEPVITFFMIVTDRDMVIADYAVRSCAKVTTVPFKLVVYSNWVLAALRAKYFPRWRELPYVEIWESAEQTDDRKPVDRRLWGPFELCYPIWDRELKKLRATPYHATVDADFEILDGDFIPVMLQRLEENSRLIAMSTDYNPKINAYSDSYSGAEITLNERWHTHFCIYKREALECAVSHAYRAESQEGPLTKSAWDDAGYFQRALRLRGFELEVLDAKYRRSFVHYGAFGQNRHIDDSNVALYRRLRIMRRVGLGGFGDPLSRGAAFIVERVVFSRVDRHTYADGWAQRSG